VCRWWRLVLPHCGLERSSAQLQLRRTCIPHHAERASDGCKSALDDDGCNAPTESFPELRVVRRVVRDVCTGSAMRCDRRDWCRRTVEANERRRWSLRRQGMDRVHTMRPHRCRRPDVMRMCAWRVHVRGVYQCLAHHRSLECDPTRRMSHLEPPPVVVCPPSRPIAPPHLAA
jgi:hypothetical protein